MFTLPNINITTIHIDRSEALRYLHHKGQELPPEICTALDDAANTIITRATPRCVYRLFPLQRHPDLQLGGTNIALPGQAIAGLLADCEYALLFAATLGGTVDDIIRRRQISDISAALMLDACASAAIEDICDQLEQQLSIAIQAQGYHLTHRFSPGYADLPLDLQQPLCTVLDATRRIGLTVSPSDILIPRKSVTAIIGLSRRQQSPAADPCADCALGGDCPFQRDGRPCGKHQIPPHTK